MKSKLIIIGLLFATIYACKDNAKSKIESETINEISVEKLNLKGTWELVGFYNYKDNIVVDSFDSASDSRQLKMYTDTKVMWSKHKPADSSEWFGYGTYSYKDDMLTEVLEFGSAVMDEVIAEKKEFKFELKLQPNHFQQIELDEDGYRIYSENYKRVE